MGSQHGVKVRTKAKQGKARGTQAGNRQSRVKFEVFNMVQDRRAQEGGNNVDRTPGGLGWSKQEAGGGGPRAYSGHRQIPGTEGYVGCWICGNTGHRKDVCGARWQQKTVGMACKMAKANGGEWVGSKLKKMARQFGTDNKVEEQDKNDEDRKIEGEGLREELAQERKEKEKWKEKAREMETAMEREREVAVEWRETAGKIGEKARAKMRDLEGKLVQVREEGNTARREKEASVRECEELTDELEARARQIESLREIGNDGKEDERQVEL